MQALFAALKLVTPTSAEGVTQITSIADMSVVAFIRCPEPEQAADEATVRLAVVLDNEVSNLTTCLLKDYNAAMILLVQGDNNNNAQHYELAEYAQPTDAKFRWIP